MSKSQVGSCLILISVLLLGCHLSAAQTWTADNGNGTYSNPLFYDEFADPDIIRVGDDFYLVGSSMHVMPGLAVLHSRDLVNWDFESYALDKLDLGPEYRLEDGQDVYGQGIWAPSFRYHNGTFYIFANVNGKTTQMLRSTSPRGPWTRTPMKRSFHDLSVLFDDDDKVYVVWGYRDINIAQLDSDLTDIVPGSERLLITKEQGMGEGLHLYKIKGKYFLTSAWYLEVMRLPVARADSLAGPWEVNQNINRGEQFGKVLGWRLGSFRPSLTTKPPYEVLPPDPSAIGRMAIHQGGIVDTPIGEWWGITMGEENAIGRTSALSPITWQDDWPYFGLPGNFGRTPRIWVKLNTGTTEQPRAPYVRSDDFSKPQLQPIWQWNHVPVDSQWSLTERPGFLRLHALPAKSLWDARNTLTQRSIGPHSIPTAVMETAGLKAGDIAGFALLIQPDAWIGVEKDGNGTTLVQHDGQTMSDQRVPLSAPRVWLRADCEYSTQLAQFSYSTDGKVFHDIGEPFRMLIIGWTFQGVRYALFSFHRGEGEAGYADFDSIEVKEPLPRGITRPIPYGKQVEIHTDAHEPTFVLAGTDNSVIARANEPTAFTVVDRNLGRVALQTGGRFVSVRNDGAISLSSGTPNTAETFQWIETYKGELTLMSLKTNRYLRVDFSSGGLRADSPGPEPNGPEGVRFDWRTASDMKAARPVALETQSSAPSAMGVSARWLPVNTTGRFHPREEASFVKCGDRLYLLGGRGILPLDIYDPKTRSWSVGAPPPIEVHHFQAVAWQGRIYIAGAMTGNYPVETPLGNILIYDPSKDSWSTGEPIPAARRRASAGVVIHDEKLYLAGGIKNGHTDGWVNWFDSYDFATKKWTELPDAPRARDHFEAAVIEGKLYAAGGRRSSAVTNQVFDLTIPEVDVFDFSKGNWSTLPSKSNLPTPRAGASAVAVGPDLIIVGGESMLQSAAHTEVEAFDTIRQEWHALPTLSEGRHGTGTVYMDGSLYTCAGAGKRGGSPLVTSLESSRFP
jgi:xylan 1,4-beta-xylosidase